MSLIAFINLLNVAVLQRRSVIQVAYSKKILNFVRFLYQGGFLRGYCLLGGQISVFLGYDSFMRASFSKIIVFKKPIGLAHIRSLPDLAANECFLGRAGRVFFIVTPWLLRRPHVGQVFAKVC